VLCSKDYVTALKSMSMLEQHDLYSLALSEGCDQTLKLGFFNDLTTFAMFQAQISNEGCPSLSHP
jgi:hypothetical protein